VGVPDEQVVPPTPSFRLLGGDRHLPVVEVKMAA
jgi:hypothetical protein